MTDKVQKIKEFLIGMAGAACCDAKTKKHIEKIILPFIDSLQEESVSEDLEEAVHEYMQHIPESEPELMDSFYTWEQMEAAFKAGAKWKEEQFEKNRIKHCNSITKEQAELECHFVSKHLDENNRMPTFLDAIEYGKDLQKQQMMKDAIDTTIKEGCTDLGIFIKGLDKTKFSFGDKVKVIVTKEG